MKRSSAIAADNSAPEAASIRQTLRPLTSFLAAPNDLIGFLKVIDEFEKVLELFLPIAAEESVPGIERMANVIARIASGEIAVAETFPKATSLAFKHRKKLNNYYMDHPLYCVYWHRAAEPTDVPHYRALLATLLPVFRRLERQRLKQPRPFQEVAYKFGLYLRQLNSASGIERSILLELPVMAQSPDVLQQQLVTLFARYGVSLKTTGDDARLAHISRVLEWYKTGDWERRRKFGKQPGVTNRAPPSSGAIETRDAEKRVTLDVLLADDKPVRTTSYFERPDEKTAREEAFDRDMDQDIAPTATTVQLQPPRMTTYFLANRHRLARKNASYVAQAIELSNQHLPITRSSLSGHELGIFLGALQDLDGKAWQEFPWEDRGRIAAWAACRFYLGRDEAALTGAVVAKSLRASDSDVAWDKKARRFLLRSSPPRHAPPGQGAYLTVSVKPFFSLGISGAFLAALDRVGKRSGMLFERSYEAEFSRLIGVLNMQFSINLTPARLTQVIPGLMSQLAPADRVIGHYFLGLPPNQHMPAVYSIIPTRRLQALFVHAVALVEKRSAHGTGDTGQDSLPALDSDNDDHVGSLHVPRLENVRATVASLKQRIAEMAGATIASLARVHNTYTTYVAFFLMATTGARPLSTLLPVAFDLDEESGLCFMSDKDNERYKNARLIWLHPAMIEQLRHYARHVLRLRQHMAIANPRALDMLDARLGIGSLTSHLSPSRATDLERLAKAAPMLFMMGDKSSQILPLLPSHLAEYAGENWNLRLVALRHFVRSHLLLTSCPGEAINALLGHFDRGEAPWDSFSTLPPALWKARLNEAILPCIQSIGFEIMPSPLFGTMAVR